MDITPLFFFFFCFLPFPRFFLAFAVARHLRASVLSAGKKKEAQLSHRHFFSLFSLHLRVFHVIVHEAERENEEARSVIEDGAFSFFFFSSPTLPNSLSANMCPAVLYVDSYQLGIKKVRRGSRDGSLLPFPLSFPIYFLHFDFTVQRYNETSRSTKEVVTLGPALATRAFPLSPFPPSISPSLAPR